MEDFVGAKFYCRHSLADGNYCMQITEKIAPLYPLQDFKALYKYCIIIIIIIKMLREFSSMCYLHRLHNINHVLYHIIITTVTITVINHYKT